MPASDSNWLRQTQNDCDRLKMSVANSKWLRQTQAAAEDSSPPHPTVEDSSSPQPFDEFIPFRKV